MSSGWGGYGCAEGEEGGAEGEEGGAEGEEGGAEGFQYLLIEKPVCNTLG